MFSEKIKKFYVKLADNSEFKEALVKFELKDKNDLSEKIIEKIIREVVLPLSKKYGYDFSEKELLEFEYLNAVPAEKLSVDNLQNISGGGGLLSLLTPILSVASLATPSGAATSPTADLQSISLVQQVATPSNFSTFSSMKDMSKFVQSKWANDLSWKSSTQDTSLRDLLESPYDIYSTQYESWSEKLDLPGVNATAAFLHDAMKTNDTWALSHADINAAVDAAESEAQEDLPENVRASLDMLSDFPTDEEGLKPYLAIEVDKFKDYIDEFLPDFAIDPQKAADDFCKRTPNYYEDTRKEPRNISQDTVTETKKILLNALNEKFPEVLGASEKTNFAENEYNLDDSLAKFKEQVSDYDRAKVVHDWVAENIAYNYADMSTSIERCEGTFRNHAEQVLKNHRGVCRGYAHLTELMMRVIEIPCVYTGLSGHAFNAIFMNGDWYLIDTTWDSYKEINKHLSGISRENATANYKEEELYNKETPDWKGHITQDYFPSKQDSAYEYNKKFISGNKDHEVKGAMYHFDGENGVCEIEMDLSREGDMVVWDTTRECIVDGELKLPEKIAKRSKWLIINDRKVLDKIKKLHIPKNIELDTELEKKLKNISTVTVDPENPRYGGSEGIVWNKSDGKILHLSKAKVHIPKEFTGNLDDKLKNVKEVTIDPDNPHYGSSEGIVWKKNTLYADNAILKVDQTHVHLSKDFPEIMFLEEVLPNVQKVTVDPDNPHYGASEGLVWNKHTNMIVYVSKTKVHIPKSFTGNLGDALKDVKEVTVDPENPHYIMYTPKLFGKPGLYKRSEYLSPFAKPLWVKPYVLNSEL